MRLHRKACFDVEANKVLAESEILMRLHRNVTIEVSAQGFLDATPPRASERRSRLRFSTSLELRLFASSSFSKFLNEILEILK